MSAPALAPRRAERCLALAVTSGKGGVGKTSVVANLAIAMSKLGLRVTVLDADLGLANLDVMLGLVPKRTIEHFFRDGASFDDITIEGPGGIRLIPAGSGIPELTRLTTDELLRFVDAVRRVREQNDLLLVDTAAGISEQVSRVLALADRVALVTWPEPTALVDAYATLKLLRRRTPNQPVGLVVNGVADEREARQVHARLLAAAERFLSQGIDLDGFVPRDEAVVTAAKRQRAVLIDAPFAPASRSLERLALRFAALAHRRQRAGAEPCRDYNPPVAEVLH
ncbi:MAG: MinD/ParA family protein [Acidobacteria bacterium]|nr:MinD/ParA family protein [Acidobacteriota bacterium]